MSGDVQPKKRKDKKRRRDDAESTPVQAPHIPPLAKDTTNEDVNIHVHKESGTGGGFCAKFVFFVLFSCLAVLIGLIITEHRGLTDLDRAVESKYAQIFEGWVDSSPDHHDDHEVEKVIESHDVDEEDHDNEDHGEHEDEYDVSASEQVEDDDEDHDEHSDEVDEEAEDEIEQSEERSIEQDEDEENDDEDNEDVEDTIAESEEKSDEDADDVAASEEQDEDSEPEQEGDDENADDNDEESAGVDDNENSYDVSEEIEKIVRDSHRSREARSAAEEEDDDDDEDKDENENIYSLKKNDDDTIDNDISGENASAEQDDDVKSASDDKKKSFPKTTSGEVEGSDEDETTQENASSVIVPKDAADESDSERQSDDSTGYENENVTSKADYNIKDEIDEAQKHVEKNSAYAIELFDKILQKYPSSPRSMYGKALALDYLADQKRSNQLLDQALGLYTKLFVMEDVPNTLFEIAADRCIKRMRFIGQYRNVIDVHKAVIDRFPDNPKHQNDLAVTYLTINRVEEARHILKQVLSRWPHDGFALVHYGFILKTTDNKLESAVDYMSKGLATKADGVTDGRFYFHLGDALARLGKTEDAMQVYEEGTANGVFLSKFQRSLYNVPRLSDKPWWSTNELPYARLFQQLKLNWKQIRDEGLSILNQKGYFQDEAENLRDTGDWKQFELFSRGVKNKKNCQKCPFTCSLIDQFHEASSCRRGQTKFSVMHPGTHVWSHCGPTNCRLRSHLGLKVPPKTFIRVASETRTWKEGEIIVFDDSFEHEVWHNGTEFRLVLIVDVWHPELTSSEKRTLSPI